MKLIKYLFALLFLFNASAQAQDSEYEAYFDAGSYDWVEDEATFSGDLDDSTAAVVMKKKYVYNFYYNEENRLIMERVFHERVYLNSTRALEEYNKVYLPTGEGNELTKFRARSITGGKVTEIDEGDIQTGELEDDPDQTYNYFAFEGLEVGSEIEYYYINSRYPITDGLMVTFQEEYEILNFEFDLITPWNLIFKKKIYNLEDSVQIDTTLEYENRYFIRGVIPAFEEEPMTPSDALKGRVIFALDENRYTGDGDITSYNYTAQNVVSFTQMDLGRKANKIIKKEAKEAQEYLLFEDPDLAPGARVEQYIKDNYNYFEAGASELRDIEFISENGVFNIAGALQLYTRIFSALEIEYELVYTTNRNTLFFDGDFQTDNFLSELLIYVVDEDLYIDITEGVSRNGVMNFNYTGTDAVFISKTQLGDEVVALTEIREIPYRNAAYTSDTIKAKVNFGPDLIDNSVDVYRALTGYSARSYQGIFELIDDEDELKEYKETLISYIDDEGTVENLEVNNAKARLLGRLPLQAKGTLKDIRIVENAGADILFNVGKLIGPQLAMYDEDSVRNHDVYNSFAHDYYRVIEFEIPEGYDLVDAEKMNFDVKLEIDGEEKAIFKSSYTIEGNKVTVTILEFYEDPRYPKEKFQEYLQVINAAADFNKVSVLLQKQS